MVEYSTIENMPADLLEHPAIKSWSKLQPERVEPKGIKIVEEKEKSAVYRIEGIGPTGTAVIAKRCRKETALIERIIYEEVLPHLPLPSLHYYGFVESDGEFCWLFFEDAGEEEYSPEVEEHRILAARWLGIMHASAAPSDVASRLPDHGPNHNLERLQLGRGAIRQALATFPLKADDQIILESIVSQCDFLEAHWRQVERFCDEMPRNVVHGDFVRKNLCVRTSQSGIALLPFDWENAGWGLLAADLARIAGNQVVVSLASPEISVYWSIVRQSWPHLSIRDIGLLANFGKIFHLIDAINWHCIWQGYEDTLDQWLGRLPSLRKYQARMAGAIQALAWED